MNVNEKLKACVRLADELDPIKNRKYNLRPTPDRRARRKEKEDRRIDKLLPINDESEIDLEGQDDEEDDDDDFDELLLRYRRLLEGDETPIIPSVSPIPVLNMTTTAIVTTTARFVGTVSPSDPDKKKKEKYDVEAFLADVDSRIAVRNLTKDEDKIKEALILVDPDKGDAHSLMTSSTFTEIKRYEDFKIRCRKIWKPKAFKDKFYNLQQLRTLKKKGTTDFSFMAEVRTVIDRVVADIMDNSKITKVKGGKREENADIREILTYVAFSTIYDSLSEENQRAFKKITLDPSVDLIDLMDSIIEKAGESRINQETVVYTESQSSSKSDKVENTLVTQQSSKNSQVKKANQQRGRGAKQNYRGQYSGNNQGRNDNQGYQYQSYYQRGRGSNRQNRGRGYNNQGNRYECRKCGRTNHKTHECYYCEHCQVYGHEISHCFARQRNEKKPNNQNNESGN